MCSYSIGPVFLWHAKSGSFCCGQDILSELLKAQANVSDGCSDRKTPLHFACEKRHIQMAAYLLQNNANPNARDSLGKTPMHYAVDHNDPPLAIVASLLASNAAIAPVDNVGDTPLHLLFRKKRALVDQSSGATDLGKVLSAISVSCCVPGSHISYGLDPRGCVMSSSLTP